MFFFKNIAKSVILVYNLGNYEKKEDDFMLIDYATAIKQLRDKMLLSQEEFAKVLGVSFASINRWENGKHEPTIKIKRKLKALFKEYGILSE